MSFRELRNFTEIMRALGYPRLISVENFRTPNFQLVADTLFWLVQRYDPNVSISDEIDTENDRVAFLTSIARTMMSKARIKLNTKKLYAADGRAVKELLKVAGMLYEATKIGQSGGDGGSVDDASAEAMPLTAKFRDLKAARALAREITERGARLHDLLLQEPQLREARQRALRFLEGGNGGADEATFVERSIREIIEGVQKQVQSLEKQCTDLENDERTLDAKIKRKQADLERSEKRLKSLQSVRPAFMDEYEKLEEELKRQYEIYLERFRNLDYLEHELDQTREAERATITQSERSIQRRKEREVKRQLHELRGEDDGDIGDGGDRRRSEDRSGGSSRRSDREWERGDSRGSRRGGSASSRPSKPRQQGSLLGPDDSASDNDSDSLSGSSGSDTDLSDEEVSMGGSSAGSGSFRSDEGSDLIDDDSDSGHSDF